MQTLGAELEATLDRLRDRRLRIRLPRFGERFRRKPKAHFHATPELFLQVGGETIFDCSGEEFRLRTHEVCVMPSGVPHGETPVDRRTPYGVLVFMEGRDGFFLHRAFATPAGSVA